MKKKIYISLPITGREKEAREHADMMKATLSRAGHKPVSPFEVYAGKNPTYAEHIGYDMIALMGCDAIMLCNGWQFSKGCRIEAKVAEEFGLEVFYEEQHRPWEEE